MYRDGQGVEQNYDEALKWFHKAADRSDPVAYYNLGGRRAAAAQVKPEHLAAAFDLSKTAT